MQVEILQFQQDPFGDLMVDYYISVPEAPISEDLHIELTRAYLKEWALRNNKLLETSASIEAGRLVEREWKVDFDSWMDNLDFKDVEEIILSYYENKI